MSIQDFPGSVVTLTRQHDTQRLTWTVVDALHSSWRSLAAAAADLLSWPWCSWCARYQHRQANYLQPPAQHVITDHRQHTSQQCNRRYQTPPLVQCCPLVGQFEWMLYADPYIATLSIHLFASPIPGHHVRIWCHPQKTEVKRIAMPPD